MENLPKNGWYVELPKNKDDIDLDKLRKALNHDYEFYIDSIRLHRFYYLSIDECPDYTDYHEGVKNLKNVTHLFLKQPEYTLDNLPEKWFVEMNEGIDLDLLSEKLDYICQGIYSYYGTNTGDKSSNKIEHFNGCINVTHLFKKQEQPMETIETIEVNGKKYRQINTQGKFENGDEVLVTLPETDNYSVGKVIGYDDNNLVVKIENKYIKYGATLIKLEEIKTKTWHYAICKDKYNAIYTSGFYESKDTIIDEINALQGNILEYHTYTEEI